MPANLILGVTLRWTSIPGTGISFSLVGHIGPYADFTLPFYTMKKHLCFTLGTIFLWMYWPSFNAALVAPDYVAQHRSVINTYFSLAAACVTTFALSPVFQRNGGKWRLSMVSDRSLNSPYDLKAMSTKPVSRIAKTINMVDSPLIFREIVGVNR